MASIEDISGTLSTSSTDDCLRWFEECHSKLLDNLTNADHSDSSKIVDELQVYCKIVHKSNLSNKSLYVSNIVQKLFPLISKFVSEIDHKLFMKTDKAELQVEMAALLNRIISTLESVGLLLDKVTLSNDQLELEEDNVDFILHIGSILLVLFQHFHKHETVYEEFLSSDVDQSARLFFSKCNEIHNQYIHFAQSVAVDCGSKKDLDRLITLINKTFFIGVAVSNLDLKTMALLWKGLLNLLKSYAVHIKHKFDLSPIVEFLYKKITEKIKSLYEVGDKNFRHLLLKVLCFLLKIIVKLCEYWQGNLETSFPSILKLIFFLYDHSLACSRYSKVNYELIEEIDRTLLAGVDSLIEHLINDREFILYFSSKNNWKEDDQSETATLLLLCSILRKLVSCSQDMQDEWFQQSILEVALKMISVFYATLFSEVKIPTSICGSSRSSREIFLYDTLLINISSLIVTSVSRDTFNILEIILITQLLRSPIPVKIFITDLWCIIDRYGSSELCWRHVKYLLRVLKEIHRKKTECAVLRSLIGRLFKFLSPNHQIKLFEEIEDDLLIIDSVQGIPTCQNVSRMALAKVHSKRFLHPTFEESIKLLKLVALVQKSDTLLDEEFNLWMNDSFLLEQWNAIVKMLKVTKLEDYDRTTDFIISLCRASSLYVTTLSSANVLQILKLVNTLFSYESSLIQLNVLKVFEGCAHIRISNSDVDEFIFVLASSFRVSLRSRNSIVRQLSMESFSYFSHITIHERIIRETISNDSRLKEDLALYLQKKLRNPPNNEKTFDSFIRALFDSAGKRTWEEQSEDFADYPSEKKRIDRTVVDKIDEAETIVDTLMNIVNCKETLNANERNKLRNLFYKVDKMRKFV